MIARTRSSSSPIPVNMAFFDELISKLDVKSDPNTRNEVIPLKHATSKDVATLLTNLVSGQSQAASKGEQQNSRPGQPVTPRSQTGQRAGRSGRPAADHREPDWRGRPRHSIQQPGHDFGRRPQQLHRRFRNCRRHPPDPRDCRKGGRPACPGEHPGCHCRSHAQRHRYERHQRAEPHDRQ